MKVILALCLLGVANAAFIPLNYNNAHVLPYTAGAFPYSGDILPYGAGPFPYTGGILPYTAGVLPTASIIAPGYVAKTPGSVHIAPLPAGLGYASHHINLAKAPGTQ